MMQKIFALILTAALMAAAGSVVTGTSDGLTEVAREI